MLVNGISMRPIEKTPAGLDWTDLAVIPHHQILVELSLPLPWLALSLGLYASPLWPLGFVASFMFFLCCLRLNHEAIHNNLGRSRRVDHLIMHGLSVVMLGSNHADAWCHLQHHKDTLGPHDHEGACAKMSLLQVLAFGPWFPVSLTLGALRGGSAAWRKRVAVDWLCIGLFLITCLFIDAGWLWLHLLAMVIGQCLTAFFAVWITHQGTIGTGLAGRSQRGLLAGAAYLMLYHREHHLFPKVPVSRLPELARRLDAHAPGYAQSRLPVTPVLDRS